VADITCFNPLSVDAMDVNSDDIEKLEEEIQIMKDKHSNGV
jgi:hypothetical protein